MRTSAEINELRNSLLRFFERNLGKLLLDINEKGTLDDFLHTIGYSSRKEYPDTFESFPDGKVVIIGESQISREVVDMIATKAGIGKSRLECCLQYEHIKSFNFSKLQYQPEKYSLILMGPMPHKVSDLGNYSSMRSKLNRENGYPPVLYLDDGNHKPKITKRILQDAFAKAIQKGYITTN